MYSRIYRRFTHLWAGTSSRLFLRVWRAGVALDHRARQLPVLPVSVHHVVEAGGAEAGRRMVRFGHGK